MNLSQPGVREIRIAQGSASLARCQQFKNIRSWQEAFPGYEPGGFNFAMVICKE